MYCISNYIIIYDIYIYGHLHLKTLALTPKDSKKKQIAGHGYIYIFIDYIILYILDIAAV